MFNYLQKTKVQQAEKGREGISGSRSLVEALRLQGMPKRREESGVAMTQDVRMGVGRQGLK